MVTALFVVTERGYWGEECVEPLTSMEAAGVDVTIATPTGRAPTVDERSVDPEEVGEEMAAEVREVDASHPGLNDPVSITAVSAADFDAVVFPGGHGTEWDINQDRHARALLRDAMAGDGKAMVVCHAVAILAFATDTDGRPLAEGRQVTGFPNAWEEGIVDETDLMDDGRKLPYWVEDEVIAAGAEWDAELDADTSVRVDGDLITARGPPSSARAATTLLNELGVEPPAAD